MQILFEAGSRSDRRLHSSGRVDERKTKERQVSAPEACVSSRCRKRAKLFSRASGIDFSELRSACGRPPLQSGTPQMLPTFFMLHETQTTCENLNAATLAIINHVFQRPQKYCSSTPKTIVPRYECLSFFDVFQCFSRSALVSLRTIQGNLLGSLSGG